MNGLIRLSDLIRTYRSGSIRTSQRSAPGLALQVYTLKLREGRKQIYTIKVSSRSDIGKVVSFLEANEKRLHIRTIFKLERKMGN